MCLFKGIKILPTLWFLQASDRFQVNMDNSIVIDLLLLCHALAFEQSTDFLKIYFETWLKSETSQYVFASNIVFKQKLEFKLNWKYFILRSPLKCGFYMFTLLPHVDEVLKESAFTFFDFRTFQQSLQANALKFLTFNRSCHNIQPKKPLDSI